MDASICRIPYLVNVPLTPSSFTARIVTGSGRGKIIGIPTLNLDLRDIPLSFTEGIYACFARLADKWIPAVLHYGPRPVFHDTPSCEVHLLDKNAPPPVGSITVAIAGILRPVRDFPSEDALLEQIRQDRADARAMLERHDPPEPEKADS